MTRMGHNEMLAELEQSRCQHLTSALIEKRPTCVAKRRNGKSPTGQHRNQERWGGAEGVRPNRLLHFGYPFRGVKSWILSITCKFALDVAALA